MNLGNIARSDAKLRVLRYGAAVVAVFMGFGLRLVLERVGGGSLPTYITFNPVVMLVALLAGFWPGMLATVVSVLVADRWILAPHGLSHFSAHPIDAIGQLLFAAMGALMCMAAELYRRARRHAADVEQQLLLRESQERYRLLFRNMSDGFALYELIDDEQGRPVDWRVLEVNDAYTRHTGIPAEKIVGRCVSQVFPTVLDEYLPRFANVVNTQSPVDFETFSKPTGRHMHIVTFPAGGRRFASIIEDITDRKHAEEALRESREDLNRAQAVALVGSWRLDVRRNVLTWSDEAHRIFGLPKGTPMSYETFLGVVHPDDRESVDREWKVALDGKPYDVEHRIVVDGEIRWVRERAHLEFDEKGQVIGGFGTTQDITEKKQTENALLDAAVQKQSAQYARSLIEVSIDPLVTISADGKITDVNEATIKATGVSREKLVGADFSSYFTEPETAREGYRQVFAKGFVTDYPLTIRHQDGRLMDVLYNASVYKDTHGKVAGVFAAARDITAQKRAEAERERYQERLRELAMRLASTEERERHRISTQIHDTVIQTLSLSNIKLGSVRKQLADARLPERADEVNSIRSLLEEAIRESRSLMAELTPPLLYELGMVPALQDLTQRLEKQHRIPIRVHDDGQPKSIDKMIHGSLFEVTRELIMNALKHAGQCTITIKLSRENDRLRICVEDDGVGFKVPEDGRFVFHQGGGFGLFSIRERLDRIGGKLNIHSEPGKGTTATILAPLSGGAS